VGALDVFTKRGVDGIVNAASVSFGEAQIPFRTDSADVLPQAARQLDEVARALQDPRLAAASFELAGHTDERGAAEYNMRLSVRRAEAVRAYLVNEGVDASRLRARGYGEARPIAFGHGPVSWAANRRVEIKRLDREDLPIVEATSALAMDFGVLHVEGPGRWELVRTGETTLTSGDVYQIYMRPQHQCYAYVYQVDALGNGKWLFPSPELDHANPLEGDGEYWLPGRNQFFRLDENKGTETIHIVASAAPGADLDFLAERGHTGLAESEGQFVKRGIGGVRARRQEQRPAAQPPRTSTPQQTGEPVAPAVPAITLEGEGEFRWTVEFQHQ
jgi:hypothetical protein